jgi:hypothetical protein
MSLSSFHAMPRRGHLKRAKQIYGYLWRWKKQGFECLPMSQITLTTKIQKQ